MYALVVACFLLSFGPAARAAGDTFMGRPKAQTMSFHGAPWLTRSSRLQEERPDLLQGALRLSPGETACDIGAGNGFHTLAMARAVSPGGRAFAVDIQPQMLALLAERAAEQGVTNVERALNTQTSVDLPPGTCDIALMVDVYHEFSDPAAMLASLRTALSPSGELVVVEYREEDPSVPIKARHKMSKRQVHKELTAHGFKLVRELDTLPWQHALFYQRDDGPEEAQVPAPWSKRSPDGEPPGGPVAR